MQSLVDGIGRGSTYALLALGITVIFGVMHLVNFAHAELITVGAYVAYCLSTRGFDWWLLVAGHRRRRRGRVGGRGARRVPLGPQRQPVHDAPRVVRPRAVVARAVGGLRVARRSGRSTGRTWAFNTVEVGGIRFEVMDLVTIAATAVVLVLTAYVFRRTLFGIAVRAASEDFDAARLMGVRANRVIAGAFAFAGFLAGVAAVLILMRTPSAEPTMGSDWLVKAVVAAIIGGLGSFTGAVVGGLALGLAEVAPARLPARAACGSG